MIYANHNTESIDLYGSADVLNYDLSNIMIAMILNKGVRCEDLVHVLSESIKDARYIKKQQDIEQAQEEYAREIAASKAKQDASCISLDDTLGEIETPF